jgi:hypothetical protein
MRTARGGALTRSMSLVLFARVSPDVELELSVGDEETDR